MIIWSMLKYLSSKYKSSLNEKIPTNNYFSIHGIKPIKLRSIKSIGTKIVNVDKKTFELDIFLIQPPSSMSLTKPSSTFHQHVHKTKLKP
jgi:hypothetical protein